MDDIEIILVDGLPGAGKSTLAAQVADELGAKVLSRDAVKEALFDDAAAGAHPSDLSDVTLEVLLWLVASADSLTVVDCAIPQVDVPRWRDVLTPRRDAVLELFCVCESGLAMRRYATRSRGGRHPAHTLIAIDQDLLDVFTTLVGFGRVEHVDTTTPVDLSALPLPRVERQTETETETSNRTAP